MAEVATVTIRPETRLAIVVTRELEQRVVDGCRRVVEVGVSEERVVVHTTMSRENALCEHEDGTITSEPWSDVRFLDTNFDEYAWGEE